MNRIHLIYLFLLFSFLLNAQFIPASYMQKGKWLPYQVMFPEGYSSSKTYPLVVFLHGAGERGDDNQKQLALGKEFLVSNFHSNYPAIVIAPQCPMDSYWSNVIRHKIGDQIFFNFNTGEDITPPMQLLTALIRNWVESGKVDKSRVYLGGLSMGGMATFELLWRMPDVFAAAFPICGGANMQKLALYNRETALWIFHGDSDRTVPVKYSRSVYRKLKGMGMDVKYTEYKGMDHNSWDSVFVEKNLAAWLYSRKLNGVRK